MTMPPPPGQPHGAPPGGPSFVKPTEQFPPGAGYAPGGGYPAATQAPPPGQVPPGWYPGPSGGMQWWDGRTWGPTAPPTADNSNTTAMFCYLGMLFVGFLVPLIILLTEGGKSRFVKHHATEALNWAITSVAIVIPLIVVYVVAFFAAFGGVATGTGGGAATGVGVAVILFILVIVVLFAFSIASLVFTIMGAVKANQRKWFRYPFAIRLVKGGLSKEEAAALDRGVVRG